MDLFKDNKFTDTAIGVYKFIVSEKSFESYIDYLDQLKKNLQGREKNKITRQLKFLKDRKKDILFSLNQKVVETLPKSFKITIITELHVLEEYKESI